MTNSFELSNVCKNIYFVDYQHINFSEHRKKINLLGKL